MEDCCVRIENLLLCVSTFVNCLSRMLGIPCYGFSIGARRFTLRLSVTETLLASPPLTSASSQLDFHSFLSSSACTELKSRGLAPGEALGEGNVVAGLSFPPDRSDSQHVSREAVSFSYVFTGVALAMSFENVYFAVITGLTFWHKRPSFWPVLDVNRPSSHS